MHYEVGEKVRMNGNKEAVGTVTEVLPGGLQNYVEWANGKTTMEWRDNLTKGE